jgi:hypothetical protein
MAVPYFKEGLSTVLPFFSEREEEKKLRGFVLMTAKMAQRHQKQE